MTRRLEWSDLSPEAQEKAITVTMSRGRLTREEAEEVVANAVARLMHLRPIVRDPKGLLVAASINLLRTERQREAGRPALLAIAQDIDENEHAVVGDELADKRLDSATEVMEREDRTWQEARLHAGFKRLLPRDQAIISAHYFEGRSLKSIDEASGERPGTARVRLFRARQRLAKLIEALDRQPDRSR